MNDYVFKKFFNEIVKIENERHVHNPRHAVECARIQVDITNSLELAIFDFEINKGNVDIVKKLTFPNTITYKLTEQGREALSIFIL